MQLVLISGSQVKEQVTDCGTGAIAGVRLPRVFGYAGLNELADADKKAVMQLFEQGEAPSQAVKFYIQRSKLRKLPQKTPMIQ